REELVGKVLSDAGLRVGQGRAGKKRGRIVLERRKRRGGNRGAVRVAARCVGLRARHLRLDGGGAGGDASKRGRGGIERRLDVADLFLAVQNRALEGALRDQHLGDLRDERVGVGGNRGDGEFGARGRDIGPGLVERLLIGGELRGRRLHRSLGRGEIVLGRFLFGLVDRELLLPER